MDEDFLNQASKIKKNLEMDKDKLDHYKKEERLFEMLDEIHVNVTDIDCQNSSWGGNQKWNSDREPFSRFAGI